MRQRTVRNYCPDELKFVALRPASTIIPSRQRTIGRMDALIRFVA